MQLLKRLRISQKITLFGVSISVIVLILMGLSLAIYDIRNIRESLEESYVTLADVVGQSCAPALLHESREEAAAVLRMLSEDPAIVVAELLDEDRNLFVEHLPAAQVDTGGPFQSVAAPHEAIPFERPIRLHGELVGWIRLHVVSDRLWRQGREHTELIIGVTATSALIAMLLAGYLQRVISVPLLHLVETVRTVSRTGDYSRRARKETRDELGDLCDEVNALLARIEHHAAEVELHRRHLESMVRLRTEALEQKTREAQEASVAKSQFLANMSHEIRTPMNAILGFTDLLRQHDDGDPQTRKEWLETIAVSGRHLLTVINDVLDLSKIEAGKLQTERIDCSPHQTIAEVCTLLRVRAVEKGLSLEDAWIGPAPPTILTDPVRLRQLLINLVGNALKFTETGGVQIVSRLDGERLRIDVIDTGPGIPQDKLASIFDPFAQADASVTRRYGGTGLGLAISRRIAEALGGDVSVDSEPGRGSTFTVTIDPGPIDAAALLDAPPAPAVALSESSASPLPPIGPARLLLVEDGETNRRLIRTMLRRHGVEIIEAENGRDGMRLALADDFDLILMDMQMPIMDGYTATAQLRAQGLLIPIVALTAHAMTGDAQRCAAAGCTDYLSKPIDEARLVRTLSRHLQGAIDAADRSTSSNKSAMSVPDSAPPAPMSSMPDRIRSSLPFDDAEFCEIIADFIARARTRVQDLHAAAADNQFDAIADVAHWLKGSGGTAGFDALTLPSARLERLARRQNADELPAAIREVEDVVARLDVPRPIAES
ncbi:MAG: response regulator [Planctomyces sp.]|nr:response regulator [Planctomyces sp.]